MTKNISTKSEAQSIQKGVGQDATYVTKKIDSSLAILDSSEDNVVMEALIFITKYVDIHENNLHYMEQHGLLKKLLNLMDRKKCILRLALKLLGVLLTLEEVMQELDQDKYDEQVLEICKGYISSPDAYVRQYCVSILSKLTESDRITCNIFSINLFKPIMDTIKKTPDMELLQWTLELFVRLLKAPSASNSQQQIGELELVPIVKYLQNNNKQIIHLVLEIIEIITYSSFDNCQEKFKNAKIVEKMINIVMNVQNREFHTIAFNIINKCLAKKETADYFIQTLEFLEFCQWAKTCEEQYHFPCILLIEQLTRIPGKRQILFDLSVEETILSFMRSSQKRILNKTCEAICNMMTHKYCCEQMLSSDLMKHLFLILTRKDDEEDPQNEVALKTIIEFSRRNFNALTIIQEIGAVKELLHLFNHGENFLSEESFPSILDILYKISLQPQYQQEMINPTFFERLLVVFEQSPISTSIVLCQIMTSFVKNYEFRRVLLSNNGPQIITETLQSTTDITFLKNILFFVYNNLPYKDVMYVFLRNNLVKALKEIPETLRLQLPIGGKILKLIYNGFPSLKFFETGKLELTDKLMNKFYLIDGLWKGQFPFLEDLEESRHSTLYTVYVVDYTADVKFPEDNSATSESMIGNVSSHRTLSTLSKMSSSSTSDFRRGLFEICYRKLSPDPFLPEYIFRITKYLSQVDTMEEKIKALAQYINNLLCVPQAGYARVDKIHNLMLHVEILKHKLGVNMIPIGFLKLGAYCQRALYFKAIADKTCIPASLVKGKHGMYWNEIALFSSHPNEKAITLYVVDLMDNVGELMLVGSRAANRYCSLK